MKTAHCALCDQPRCTPEQLEDGWRLCGSMGFVYRANDDGEVVEWATTSKSHPRGVFTEPVTRPAHDGRPRKGRP